MICGMIAGRTADTLFPVTGDTVVPWGSAKMLAMPAWWRLLLVTLLVPTVLMRRSHLATTMITGVIFSLGAFLMTNSDRYHTSQYENHAETSELREKMSAIYARHGLDGDALAVTNAMTLGEKGGISRSMKQMYSDTGASHIFALSGLHLGIIFMLLMQILRPLHYLLWQWRGRWLLRLIPLTAIWCYVSLVGFHASVVRAAVMLTVYGVCSMMSRKTDSISVLSLTAILLLAWHPQWLYDVGFQMSFLAVMGIIIIYRPLFLMVKPSDFLSRNLYGTDMSWWKNLNWFLRNNIITHYLWGLFCVSFSAQLMVLPLIAYYFGRIPCYGLLANYIVSPLAVLIILLAILLLITRLTVIGNIITIIIDIQNKSLNWLSSLPGACINDVNPSLSQTLLVYIIIACAISIGAIIRRTK